MRDFHAIGDRRNVGWQSPFRMGIVLWIDYATHQPQ